MTNHSQNGGLALFGHWPVLQLTQVQVGRVERGLAVHKVSGILYAPMSTCSPSSRRDAFSHSITFPREVLESPNLSPGDVIAP